MTAAETPYGVVFSPALEGLPPGVHGFHVHENGSCAPKEKDGKTVPALAAGGHYDPQGSKRHGTPWGDGHLGHLPGLVVDAEGKASYAVGPRAAPQAVGPEGASLMIHVGGDNHVDHPMPRRWRGTHGMWGGAGLIGRSSLFSQAPGFLLKWESRRLSCWCAAGAEDKYRSTQSSSQLR